MKTKKRGRPAIKPHIKQLIFAKALQDKDTPRLALVVELKNLIGDMCEVPPTEETMMRLISQARNHPVSELDEQWSVGRLAQYDIPPEALAVVLSIYEQRLRTEEYSFTIREALWIARLYKVIDDPIVLEPFASAYALRDKIDWILDNPVYTRGFDFELINYNNEDRRAEVIARVTQFPGLFNPFPSSTSEEEEEVKKKLKQKGYDIKTPGEELLYKHVAELNKEAVRVWKHLVAQLEQKKPEELNEKEARLLKSAKGYLKVKEAQHER